MWASLQSDSTTNVGAEATSGEKLAKRQEKQRSAHSPTGPFYFDIGDVHIMEEESFKTSRPLRSSKFEPVRVTPFAVEEHGTDRFSELLRFVNAVPPQVH